MTEEKCAINDHISREAGDKTKGFRFQKLRAAIRFLERVQASNGGQVHCAMELLEDSVLFDGHSEALISGEENKYYGSRISFNSSALKNTLVAFLELYFPLQRAPELKLGVYASAEIARERVSAELLESLGLEPKQKHKNYDILLKLTQGIDLDDEECKVAFAIARSEYFKQYKDSSKGYKAMVDSMSLAQFSTFIKSVDWSLTDDSNESLEAVALQLVRTCKFFTHRHTGLEEFILSTLLNELEKRSGATAITDRLLNTDALKNIFNDILFAPSADELTIDPAWDDWGAVEQSDFRNLAQKITSVCPDFNPKLLKAFARSCSLARNVGANEEKEMKALLRRILDVCEAHLLSSSSEASAFTQRQVLDMIDDLVRLAEQHVASLRGRYQYGLRDAQSIKGAVLTLFDDCYLAFDEAQADEQ